MRSDSLDRLADLVTAVTRDAAWRAHTTREGSLEVTMRLDPEGVGPDVRPARLRVFSGGVFLLDTSDRYGTVIFPHTDADEVETVQQLVAVAHEHLLGHSHEGEEVRSRGRRRGYLDVVVDGEVHRLTGPVRRDPSHPRRWWWHGLRR